MILVIDGIVHSITAYHRKETFFLAEVGCGAVVLVSVHDFIRSGCRLADLVDLRDGQTAGDLIPGLTFIIGLVKSAVVAVV